MERSKPTRLRVVAGPSSFARSLAQPWTSLGFTSASRRFPNLVPPMWLSMRPAVRRSGGAMGT